MLESFWFWAAAVLAFWWLWSAERPVQREFTFHDVLVTVPGYEGLYTVWLQWTEMGKTIVITDSRYYNEHNQEIEALRGWMLNRQFRRQLKLLARRFHDGTAW